MRERKKCDTERRNRSAVDIFVFLYGLFTLLSFGLSDYRQTALFGYVNRYMGLVTQLTLVCSYFLVSRLFVGRKSLDWLRESMALTGRWKKKITSVANSILILTGMVIALYQLVEPVRRLFAGWKILGIDALAVGKRSVLWDAAFQYFWHGDWKQKLFGAGPDCFGHGVSMWIDLDSQMLLEAQPEWMHLLVSGGLLGMLSYMGIFTAAFWELFRKRKQQPLFGIGMVVIIVYLWMGTIRSQLIGSTMPVFLVLGFFMGICRKEVTWKAADLAVSKKEETVAMELAFSFLMEESAEEEAVRQKAPGMGAKEKCIGKKGKRMQRLAIFSTVLMTGAVLCLGYSAFLLFDLWSSETRSEAKMAALREQTVTAVPMETEKEKGEDVGTGEMYSDDFGTNGTTETKEEATFYYPLFEQNEDMAAWLKIEGTNIDYPVMQTPKNENYYLYKDFYGKYDRAGCLILDTDSDLYAEGTTNQVIHGHNMKSGTMFGELDKYAEAEYGKEHSLIQLITKEDIREYEVIAVFYSKVYLTTDVTFKFYNFFRADTKEQFGYFYDNIKALSLYDTGVEAELGDRFLTLSTCSYHTEDGRFVVVAREVKDE